MNRKFTALKPSLLTVAAAVSAALAASAGSAAYAQSPGADDLTEVTVTGSRIVRRDLEANSPIVTVDAAAFEQRSGQNVESYLNSLPAYNPAASPTTMEDDIQPTAVNAVGIATVSLRGFGPNRSLVLMDGRRAVPANALMVTDVNTIPSALIERVEIISGGASAVYGADAVGGVTNFILKKNFRGVQFDAQYGFTEAGDGQESRISGLMGTDFAEGRGNITVALEHYERKAAYERNREFYRKQWADPNQLTDDLFFYGSGGYNTGTDAAPGSTPAAPLYNTPNNTTMRALLGTPLTSGLHTGGASAHQYRFGPAGEVLAPLFGDNTARYESLGLIDGQRIARVNNYDNSNGVPGNTNLIQTLKYNDQEALASAPQERYSFFASTRFDFTDKLTFHTRANFSQNKTHTAAVSHRADLRMGRPRDFRAGVRQPGESGPRLEERSDHRGVSRQSDRRAVRQPHLHPHRHADRRGQGGRPSPGLPRSGHHVAVAARSGRLLDGGAVPGPVARPSHHRQHQHLLAVRSQPRLQAAVQGLDGRALRLARRAERPQPVEGQPLPAALARDAGAAGLGSQLRPAGELGRARRDQHQLRHRARRIAPAASTTRSSRAKWRPRKTAWTRSTRSCKVTRRTRRTSWS